MLKVTRMPIFEFFPFLTLTLTLSKMSLPRCLSALSCCHVIGWLAICVNTRLNTEPNKVASLLREEMCNQFFSYFFCYFLCESVINYSGADS